MLVSEINIDIMKETVALFLLESWAAESPYTIQKEITSNTTVMVKVMILLLITINRFQITFFQFQWWLKSKLAIYGIIFLLKIYKTVWAQKIEIVLRWTGTKFVPAASTSVEDDEWVKSPQKSWVCKHIYIKLRHFRQNHNLTKLLKKHIVAFIDHVTKLKGNIAYRYETFCKAPLADSELEALTHPFYT